MEELGKPEMRRNLEIKTMNNQYRVLDVFRGGRSRSQMHNSNRRTRIRDRSGRVALGRKEKRDAAAENLITPI